MHPETRDLSFLELRCFEAFEYIFFFRLITARETWYGSEIASAKAKVHPSNYTGPESLKLPSDTSFVKSALYFLKIIKKDCAVGAANQILQTLQKSPYV